ncbi:MAG: hypothetical protein AAGM67_20540, partial [Bacteroidota bacterium]
MKSLLIVITTLFLSLPFSPSILKVSLPDPQSPAISDSTDITEWLKARYGKLPVPTKEFRKGHVSTRQIVDLSLKRVNGFAIQLPHRGMTPSPTVVGDLLLVSGGFGSKEYYA